MIGFTKVALPYGWMGNMSPDRITHLGREWRTAEALFQSMRFKDPEIQEAIRLEVSPMAAKFKAKANREHMHIQMLSEADLSNMRTCVRLKFDQNPELIPLLIETGDEILFEDVTTRLKRPSSTFWGAYINEHGVLWGQNQLGLILMDLRKIYIDAK